MGRWEPGARERLEQAALQLFVQHGYENTTVSDIAAQAGLTERTFFRHYADKREVLFGGGQELQDIMVEAARSAPTSSTPFTVVGVALAAMAGVLEPRRASAGVRAGVVAASSELQERELRKRASLAQALTEVLVDRGADKLTARLIAEAGIGVFSAGFAQWVSDGESGSLADVFDRSLDVLRASV